MVCNAWVQFRGCYCKWRYTDSAEGAQALSTVCVLSCNAQAPGTMPSRTRKLRRVHGRCEEQA